MKSIRLVFSFIVILRLSATAQAQHRDSFSVYLFLLEDCKITQAYTDRLGEIFAQYRCDSIAFIGLFPNPISADSTVQFFQKKYDLPFTCTAANAADLAERFDVHVTPEVVLYNETEHKTLYQGRIDNMFERLGERRQVVTSFELEAALYSVRHNREVPIPKTKPVGCFLPKRSNGAPKH